VIVPDVNVLVYAHRRESPDHDRYGAWLAQLAAGPQPFGLFDLVGSAFVRIVTNPRIWQQPTRAETAVEFVDRLRARRACRVLLPGQESWALFARLATETNATGKLVADAYLAALTIEHGATLATCDGDFARFAGLRWAHPLQASS